jgi:hypothetical protein
MRSVSCVRPKGCVLRGALALVYTAHTQVGGKMQREVTLQTIQEGKVLFETLAYQPQDPSCCPSQKGHTAFTLQGKQLKEQ